MGMPKLRTGSRSAPKQYHKRGKWATADAPSSVDSPRNQPIAFVSCLDDCSLDRRDSVRAWWSVMEMVRGWPDRAWVASGEVLDREWIRWRDLIKSGRSRGDDVAWEDLTDVSPVGLNSWGRMEWEML